MHEFHKHCSPNMWWGISLYGDFVLRAQSFGNSWLHHHFREKPLPSKDVRPILLPYRSSVSSEDSMSEVSQPEGSRSSVKYGCRGIIKQEWFFSSKISPQKGQQSSCWGCLWQWGNASVKARCQALPALTLTLFWLLLADFYYSLKLKDDVPPPTADFSNVSLLLPPPSSPKEYLYVQYGGEGSAFNLDPSAVEAVYKRMFPETST